jgi:histidine phosphotransferase ChpT
MTEVHRFPDAAPRVRSARDDLFATVASRICHDLVSPLGAIANGVELIALTGGPPSPEMDLIRESVENATARLRFFRLAYGAAPEGTMTPRTEVVSTLRAVTRAGRLSYDWEATGDVPRAEARAIFLLLQCLESAMPMGGHIRVTRDGPAWAVTGEGPRMRVDEGLWTALQTPRARPPEGSALVQFALLPLALQAAGRTLALKLAEGRIDARL